MVTKFLLLCLLPGLALAQPGGQQLQVFRTRGTGVCPGKEAKNGDKVTWAYSGKFQDGRVFDKGQLTIELGKGQVIQGVDLGMQGMCIGEHREIIVPSHLGYGDRGAPPTIPPFSTLVFEVVMVQIEAAGKAPATGAGTTGTATAAEVKINNLKTDPNCVRKSQTGDKITWFYIGTLTEGTEFDRGDLTATLGKGEVIRGVDIGMQGMCVGDKRRMVIPPHLAYGPSGIAGVIPPNASLVFEVELKKIE